MHRCGLLLALLGLWYIPASAQTVLREQIWSSVIFSLYGDRTPYILPETYTLTPLGAQQLYSAGSAFRERYVSPLQTPFSQYSVNTAINGISEFQLDNNEVTMESTADQFIVASAQAFIQGLYPPLRLSSNDTFVTSQSSLANGSNILSPLDGYQYPQIYTASRNDDDSIWIAGEIGCEAYTASSYNYYSSPEYANILNTTAEFYASLQQDFLDGIFTNSSVGYFNAYWIWDYLNYGVTHNTSIATRISEDELLQARALADKLTFALNGNISASGSTPGDQIRAIGGKTLATRIVEALYTNIDTSGQSDKLTLLFGSFEPMISFAALAGLASPQQTPQFYSIPEPGSSMVFELFSLSANGTESYPARSDLNVRFLFQNGTGDGSELISYSLFGNDPSQDVMTVDDFIAQMEAISIPSISDWCEVCSSFSVFCPAFVGDDGHGSSSGLSYGAGLSGRRGISPAVAGVIGAVVALAVAGIVAAVAALFGGVRVYRSKGRSDLGGFKGGEKLASDLDLTVAKSNVGATITAVSPPPAGRLHERVGSWELGDQAKAKELQVPNFMPTDLSARRPSSFEDDELHITPFAVPTKPDDRV